MFHLKYNHLFTVFFLSTASIAAEQEVIIGFHDKITPSQRELIFNAGGEIRHEYGLIPALVAVVPESALPALNQHPSIAYLEENKMVTAVEPPTAPGVTYTPELFVANTPEDEYERSWGVQHIGSKAAHQQGITGKGIKIAVIDSGIDYYHEDLDDNYRGGHNFIDSNAPPLDDSLSSHGTHVAGIIAAEKNGTGVVGVAPEASLYSLKVLNNQGMGLIVHIIAALEWSVEHGMDIANISIEGGHTEALEAACNAAREAGVLVIAAAGNSFGEKVSYPAAYNSVIAVTGTNSYNLSGYFSPIGTEIELSAPGVVISSTARNGEYSMLSGTSQAAPHVAGTAALIMSKAAQYPTIPGLQKNEDTRIKLQMAARDLGETGKDDTFGYGLVNAELPSTKIDNVSCTDTTITLKGTGFGRYMENSEFTTTLVDTATAEKCNIESWTTSEIIADCGPNASGSVKVTGIFGSASGTCHSSHPSPARPKWWLLGNWWSSWR